MLGSSKIFGRSSPRSGVDQSSTNKKLLVVSNYVSYICKSLIMKYLQYRKWLVKQLVAQLVFETMIVKLTRKRKRKIITL